jgi:hypothetical protein
MEDVEASLEDLIANGLFKVNRRFSMKIGSCQPVPFGILCLRTKARFILRLGPEAYFKSSRRFKCDHSGKEKDPAVFSVYRQFLERKGFSVDNPLNDVGIESLYTAMALLDFLPIRQFAHWLADGLVLDAIDFEHMFLSRAKVKLYNKVDVGFAQANTEPG